MDIFPQDLSSRYHIELVRRRSAKGFGEPQVDEPIPKPQLGKIGSYWAQGMELTEEQAALAAPASAMGTKGVASVTMLLGGIFVALTGVAVGASLRNEPATDDEVAQPGIDPIPTAACFVRVVGL